MFRAKDISIESFLMCEGFRPSYTRGNNLWYLSPLRSERTPSFKVNTKLNVWYDFGIGKGGNIVSLCKELWRTEDIKAIYRRLCDNEPSFTRIERPPLVTKTTPSPTQNLHLEEGELKSDILLKYLDQRGISAAIAQKFCKEVRYGWGQIKTLNHLGIGFKNRNGGWEIRNQTFKGSLKSKDITYILNSATEEDNICIKDAAEFYVCQTAVAVFEGFIDFLSYQTILEKSKSTGVASKILPKNASPDYIVLNSVSNLRKAFDILNTYEVIYCYLDNDTAGYETTALLQAVYEDIAVDMSHTYSPEKDINDYLLRH